MRGAQEELRVKPPDPPRAADDGAGEGGEDKVRVGAARVADREATEPGGPRERAPPAAGAVLLARGHACA